MLETDALSLDGFDELHKGRSSHDRDGFFGISAEIHPAQAAPEGLLGKDFALRAVFPQPDNHRHVADVPAFLEHQYRDDGLTGRLPGIDFVGLLAEQFELFLFLA